MPDISIKQIAEIAGVSRGTVDRALNGRPGIDPAQKERILKVASGLGYRSNRAGRLLSIRKSPLRIGIQMPSEGNEFFDEVKEGLFAAGAGLRDFGVTLSVRTMKGFDAAVQEQQIRDLAAEGIGALAFVPIESPAIAALVDELAGRGIPCVTFNSDISGTRRLCHVGNDYRRSGAVAAGALRLHLRGEAAGVLVLTGSSRILGHRQRVEGFTRILEETCPQVRILDVLETQDDEETAYILTRAALSSPSRPAAIYAAAGGAAGICRAVEESGLAGRIAVICNDLTGTEKEYLRRGVISATVCQQPYEQGYRPVRYLFDYFLDGTLPPDTDFTGSELILREHLADIAQT